MRALDDIANAFESSVNSEGIETPKLHRRSNKWFESSVNSEGIETVFSQLPSVSRFESSVNSEGIETQSASK